MDQITTHIKFGIQPSGDKESQTRKNGYNWSTAVNEVDGMGNWDFGVSSRS